MENELKEKLEQFDKGSITIKMFIDGVRKISNTKNKLSINKYEIIAEYLEQQKRLKEKKHHENNLKAYKKWISNPENKQRRKKLDSERYQRNKSTGNQKIY